MMIWVDAETNIITMLENKSIKKVWFIWLFYLLVEIIEIAKEYPNMSSLKWLKSFWADSAYYYKVHSYKMSEALKTSEPIPIVETKIPSTTNI